MPDFERLFDEMSLDSARTPEEKAYVKGYIEGKNFARKQIAYVAAFVLSAYFIGLTFY